MRIISAIYRKLDWFIRLMLSKLRIIHIRLKYPGADISFDTYIEKNCKIICTNGSRLVLRSVFVSSGCHIFCGRGGRLEIHKTFIGRNTSIVATENIIVEKDCQIAEMVVIRDQNHNYGAPGKTVAEQGSSSAPIHIGENVWLACKVTVLAGSVIGRNSVVGAHAVVKGELQSNSLYVGIPAKLKITFA